MTRCWDAEPSERPTSSDLRKRLGELLEDVGIKLKISSYLFFSRSAIATISISMRMQIIMKWKYIVEIHNPLRHLSWLNFDEVCAIVSTFN